VPYAPANLEGVSAAALRLARQWPDPQISVQVFEDLQLRAWRVVSQQGVETAQPRRAGPRLVFIAGNGTASALSGALETQASVEADARRAAKALAKQLTEYFASQGWIVAK
jgi:hypothetical protein